MHFLCQILAEEQNTHKTLSLGQNNETGLNGSDFLLDVDSGKDSGFEWSLPLVVVRIITPNLCILGICGNSLNIFILTRRVSI